MRTTESRRRLALPFLLSAALVLLRVAALPAQTAELAIVGGVGQPGETVTVRIELSRDVGAAAADLDIRFPPALVEFNPPVAGTCRIADRLAATHQIAGTLVEPGLVRLAIFARELRILPLQSGELATCGFHILSDAGDATARLEVAFAGLAGPRGGELPVIGVPGKIVIRTPVRCAGDCNANAAVTIEELIRGVQIVLGNQSLDVCPSLDRSGTGIVSISDMINAVNNTLFGCPAG